MRLKRLFKSSQSSAPQPSEVSTGRDARPDIAGRDAFLKAHVFLHTHIPKTAGSSLSSGLSGIVGGTYSMELRYRRAIALEEMSQADRNLLHFVSGHFQHGVHRHFDRTPLYVAALRDPAERAVSGWRFLREHTDHGGHARAMKMEFPAYWEWSRSESGGEGLNGQARVLCGDAAPSEALLRKRADTDYFLLIPQHHMTRTLQRLRGAFGVAWTRTPPINVSKAHEITLDPGLRAEILSANALDTALVQRIEAEFEERLQKACDVIASHCLLPLKDASD